MRLDIEGLDKLTSVTDRQLSVLNCVTQKDLYSIEFMYNNDVENRIFYLIIMRKSIGDNYPSYFVNPEGASAFPISINHYHIQTIELMMGFLRGITNKFYTESMIGSLIHSFSDLKNLSF